MTVAELKEYAREKQKLWQSYMKPYKAIGEIIEKMDELQKTITVDKEEDVNLEDIIGMDEAEITVKVGGK